MRTTQTRKRSRSSGGGYRNKRRKIFRRVRRAGVNATGISQYGQRIRASRIRGRRMRRSLYRRNLYNFSSMLPRYHVATTSSNSRAAPTNLLEYDFTRTKCLPGLFDSTKWVGSYDASTVPTAIGDYVIVRGGEERLTIASEATEAMDYRVQLVWLKPGATIPSEGNISKSSWSLDNSLRTGTETMKIMKQWEGTLQYLGGSATFIYKPKLKKYKRELTYNLDLDCMYWFVYLGNTVNTVANIAVITINSSVSVAYVTT